MLDWRKLDRLKNHPLVARLLGDNQETLDGDGLGFQALVEKGRVMGRRERNSGSIPLLLLSILGALVFFLTGYGEGICFSIVLAYAAIFAFLVEEFGRIPFIENSRWNRDFGKLYLLPIPGRTLVNQAFNRGAKLLGLLFLVGLVSILSQRLDNNERLGVVAFSLLLYFLVLMVYAIYLSSIPGQLLPKKEKGSWVWGALFLLVFPFLASILWAIIYLALRPVGFDYNSSGLILAILLILPLLLFIRFYLNDATTSYDRLSIH